MPVTMNTLSNSNIVKKMCTAAGFVGYSKTSL